MKKFRGEEKRSIGSNVPWSIDPVSIPGVPIRDYAKEYAFQTYCADWLRKQYQLTNSDAFRFWHHSANEGGGMKRGFMVKLMGQSPGFPDLIHPGMKLAIELKVPGGQISIVQKVWLDHFESLGWKTATLYTFSDFENLVRKRARAFYSK